MIQDPKLRGPDAIAAPANENEETPAASRLALRRRRKPTKKATPRAPRPAHYKVICISIYTKDLEQLDAKVAELKARGKTKMSKSELIRLALASFNPDEVA